MKSFIKIIALILYISVSPVLAFADDDDFKKCGEARYLILSGMELYLIDHKDAAADSFEKIISADLVAGKYMSEPQSCPGGGIFSYSHKPARDDWFPKNALICGGKRYILEIKCSIHGGIESFFDEVEKKKFAMSPSEKADACVSNMKTIKGALELYYLDKHVEASSIDDLLKNGFLKCSLKCYSNGAYELKKLDSGSGSALHDVICSVHGSVEKAK